MPAGVVRFDEFSCSDILGRRIQPFNLVAIYVRFYRDSVHPIQSTSHQTPLH